jgi:spermidine synthase
MDLWFTEKHSEDAEFSIRFERQIFSAQSEFQRVDVLYSREFGKILALDGFLMVTEKDEFIYHEMMVHVPLAVNPDVRRVLVIGAGDGGAVRELARYKTIERIDVAEIDKMVVDVCREFLPNLARGFDDPRVALHFEDGLKFVRREKNFYDLILVDSTDPFGPGEGLFTKEFYGVCFSALTARGLLTNQHESVYYAEYAGAMRRAHKRLRETFPVARVYQAHIPTYPSGHWLFGFASKGLDPLGDFDADAWNARGLETRYYNTDLHRGCFAIPNYVKEKLDD